jgi:DNA-binding response OmpR family regulator
LRILFVDNHPEFARVVTTAFLSTHEVFVVPTVAGAIAALEAASFDVALVDYDLDDGKGDAVVHWVRANVTALPIIAISAHREGNDTLIQAGAHTVCAKAEFSRIGLLLSELT